MSDSIHLTCPHCDTTNRLSYERLLQAPKCGKCGEPLFSGKALEMTDTNAARVLERTEIPLVLDCWAAWCGPCRQFAPVFEQAAQKFEPKIRFAKLDTDAHPRTSAKFQIRSIPTLILFAQGKEIARESGAMSPGQFAAWLAKHLVDNK